MSRSEPILIVPTGLVDSTVRNSATVFGLTYDGSPVQYHHLRNIDVGQLCAPGENNLRIFYLWWMENCLQVQRAGHKAQRDCKGPMCQSIEIYLENDLPLIVRYAVASLGEIKLCLAPLPSS